MQSYSVNQKKESLRVKVVERSLPLLLVFVVQLVWLAPAWSQKVESPLEAKIKLELAQKLNSKKIELSSGTKIKLELAEELSSKKAEEGDEVVYFVAEDVVTPNKETLIKKGARAIGKVTEAKRARTLGRKGKLEFTVEEVEAVDGTKVPLRATVNKDGKSRGATMVAVTALVSVFGLFIKGKNVTIKQGTVVDAYVDDSVVIEVPILQAHN